MKIKKTFVTQNVAGSQIMVPVGGSAKDFSGFIRSNETAAFLVDLFREDTTPEEAVKALMAEFIVDQPRAERAVTYVIDTLTKINAFE